MTRNEDGQPLRRWLLAARPKTLTLAATPVVTGTALAWVDAGLFAWGPALAALLAALLIQAGTNLYNDAADFERGADTPDRIGPLRATAAGWFSAGQVKRAAWLSFGAAFLLGIYLAWVGGWPIVALGLLSLISGWAYTGGPRPLAYTTGVSELFVWLFFGLGAVMGSYYLQTGALSWSAFLAGTALGLLAAAVLVVNNYRDLDADRRAGRQTLAVVLGRPATRLEYAALMATPFLLLPLLSGSLESPGGLLPLLLLPWAGRLLWRFFRDPPGPGFNRLLAQTAQFQTGFGLLLSIGLLL